MNGSTLMRLLSVTLGLALQDAGAETKLVTGFVKREIFLGITGNTVADLTGSEKFVNHQPDGIVLLPSLEAPSSSGENYGQRLSGLLVPPTSGDYVFFVASDEESELWLSTDDTASAVQWVAGVTGRTNRREWNKFPDTQNNAASPRVLVAGKSYYFEVLMKEASSGDHLSVGWVLPGQYVDPANAPDGLTNITVIPGTALGAVVEATHSNVRITTQPASVSVSTGSRALFSIQAEGTSDLGSQVLYQWKRNDADIAGATTASYLTAELAPGDSGARYACVASVPGATVTSAEATLTVSEPAPPRMQISTPPSPPGTVAIAWDSPDPGYQLLSASSLGVPWSPASERPTYEGTTARVSVNAIGNRFFRLGKERGVPESLWPPETTPGNDVTGVPGYELGTVFSAAVPGLVRAIRLYALPGEYGVRTARIWRNSDNSVAGGPYPLPVLGNEGWVAFDLPSALAIEAGVEYTVSVSTAEDAGRVYPRSENVLTAAGSNDRSLRYPLAAGVFGSQLGARPTQTDRNSLYFRDIVFLPGDVPSENIIVWPLDQPVSFGRGGDEAEHELGTVFRSSTAGAITAIRVFGTAAESGAHMATIWRNSDDAVIGGPYELVYGCGGAVCGSVWVDYQLPEPVSLEPGTDYTISVSTGADLSRAYPYINQAFLVAGTNGRHLSFPAGAGVSGPLGARPTEKDPAASPTYLRDIVFQATGSTEGEDLTGGGAVYSGSLSGPTDLGTVFQASSAGTIKAIRVYSASAESGTHTARIWRNDDNSVLGGPYSLVYGGTSGWTNFALATPLTIEPNVAYTVSVSTGEDPGKAYPFVPEGFAGSGGNTKHLSYPAKAGVMSSTPGTRPTETPNAHSYLRDIVFQPSTEQPRATFGNTTDGTFRDYITDANDAYINANRFVASADMTVTTIKAKVESAPGHYKCAIYSDKEGVADRLLAASEEKGNPATGWNEFRLAAPLKLKAGDAYWIGIWSDDRNARVYYSSQTGGRLRWKAWPYGDWPDPIEMDPNGSEYLYCLYAEGTFDAPKPRATLGNSTDGTFRDYITDANDAYINANRFQASGNMTVTTIKAKIENAPGHYKCAIYSDKDGLGELLLGSSAERANPPNGWNEFPLPAPLKLKAGEYYWIGIWSDDPNARVYYSSQTGGRLRWKAWPYGDWPDPIEMDPNGSEYLYCLYAEGTSDD